MINLMPSGKIKEGVLQGRVHIIASPFKTGTSSVGEALKVLGVGRRRMRHRGRILQNLRPVFPPLNQLALDVQDFASFEASHGARVRKDLAPLVRAIASYDIFHDAPFGHTHLHPFIRKVLAPKACFIWVNRAPEDWIASVRKWEECHPDLYAGQASWQDDPDGRAERHLKTWRRQYQRFQQLARAVPQDCLELDWSDLQSFKALAAFYKVSSPDVPFPRANVGGQDRAEAERLRGVVTLGRALADRVPVLEEPLLRLYAALRKE